MLRCARVHRLVASLLASTLAAGGPAETSAPTEDPPAEDAAAEDAPADAPVDEAPGGEAPDEPPDGTEAGEPGQTDAPPAEGLPGVEDAPGEEVPAPEPEPQPEPQPEPKPEGPKAAPAPEVVLEKDRLGCDHSKSCRQLTLTGTVLGSLGVLSVGAGIALFVRDDVVLEDEPAYATSTKPPGLIALTLGSGVVITSVLMLIAAHRGYKQRDAQSGKAAWLRTRGVF